jgi:hypothetical protein
MYKGEAAAARGKMRLLQNFRIFTPHVPVPVPPLPNRPAPPMPMQSEKEPTA